MQLKDVVIVSACRTPIGKMSGQFKDVSARDLAITAGTEAIKRAGIDAKLIDEIVMGEVLAGMQGSLPAMQVASRIGLDARIGGVTVNQNCASGMRALEIACDHIALGKTDIGLVVGVESMTNAPYMLAKARGGYRMGDSTIYDSMIHDALFDELTPGHMGITAENVAEMYGITREECDQLAMMSHNRACAAIEAGKFKEEIVPVVIKSKKGEKVIDTDEHPIPNTTMETLGKRWSAHSLCDKSGCAQAVSNQAIGGRQGRNSGRVGNSAGTATSAGMVLPVCQRARSGPSCTNRHCVESVA